MNFATTLDVISVVAGGMAALVLYWSSLSVPWDNQTMNGTTEFEKRYKRKRRLILWWLGIPCVLISVGLQIVVISMGVIH